MHAAFRLSLLALSNLQICTSAAASLHENSPTISYTPLGDSYASGNGAGVPIDPLCGRYNLAYPVLLAQYFSLTPVSETFYNEACGGAATWSVQAQQLGHIDDSDLVTLTVGGNEVEFFVTLNDCVYHWWEGLGCEAQLERTRRAIESTALIDNYSNLVRETVERLKPGARLFVTGYATFFNEETSGCDDETFSVKEPYQYLTRELRRDLNDVVRVLNAIIKGVTSASGAEYVDIDTPYRDHRFCEEDASGSETSDKESWFYNLDTADSQIYGALGTVSQQQQETLHSIGHPLKDFEKFTRVFHPTPEGHEAIADAIFRQWAGKHK
ncbi:MAG: hypothetical protein Q9160_002695 [Pyrenula sp. 1 TL-2023]